MTASIATPPSPPLRQRAAPPPPPPPSPPPTTPPPSPAPPPSVLHIIRRYLSLARRIRFYRCVCLRLRLGTDRSIDERLTDECTSYSVMAHWGGKTPVKCHRAHQEVHSSVGHGSSTPILLSVLSTVQMNDILTLSEASKACLKHLSARAEAKRYSHPDPRRKSSPGGLFFAISKIRCGDMAEYVRYGEI
eukprot:2230511-Prymnesium_polylepis.1